MREMKDSKFEARNLVERNHESQGSYEKDNQIKFKSLMIRSNLCGFSDGYTLVPGTITITGRGTDDAAKRSDERTKGAVFKNRAPFTDCVNNINNI